MQNARGLAASPIDTATSPQQNSRGFAASPIDTATSAKQNARGLAASPNDTATSPQQNSRGFAASPIDTATSAQQNTRGFAASPIDTATSPQQNSRGFAASPIDTATSAQQNTRKCCSFPYRHGDVCAAKQRRSCSFPFRNGDVCASKHMRFCSFPFGHGDVCAAKHTRFCSFPYRHRINVAKNVAKKGAKKNAPSNWRRTRVQPPDPQTINGNPSLRIREQIKQWCCNRRSIKSEMVSRKVFQSGFRPVSYPFGGWPFSGKEAELKHGHCHSEWSGDETKTYKINPSFLQQKSTIKQWCCNRRSKESEMVSRKVLQSGFRPVSDAFGGAQGACPFPEKRLNLNTDIALRNAPVLEPKHTTNTSFLQQKRQIKQWWCNRRSIESEMVSRKVFQTSFRLLLGLSTRLSQVPKFIWVLAFQNGRFGNQKLQGEVGERKQISPEESVLK